MQVFSAIVRSQVGAVAPKRAVFHERVLQEDSCLEDVLARHDGGAGDVLHGFKEWAVRSCNFARMKERMETGYHHENGRLAQPWGERFAGKLPDIEIPPRRNDLGGCRTAYMCPVHRCNGPSGHAGRIGRIGLDELFQPGVER